MECFLTDKLATEITHYQDKDFLKAVMAVCALTAGADDEVLLAERCAITSAIQNEPAFHGFNVDKAIHIINEYIESLQEDGDHAREVLRDKVRRIAGHHKRSRTLMRIARLIITADYDVDEREESEFRHLCELLDLDYNTVWGE